MRARGFTLIELMVVLLLLALLASIVAPVATKSVGRAKESTLKEDLFILRKGLDDYYSDHGKYPEELQTLVEEHYIRDVPKDPVTDDAGSWVLKRTDDNGIIDVHSGADGTARDGTRYSDW
ncbi:MAG TPA: prepilin-type N-terminal cleavage/methylation domain-containing protein [Gammaproteobacteria bacterium]|nr:prepilin-type N-terminal cleavage/methylation domain-containing protein [Gammaproteobacteria bacterium]